jgi:hypothetical protein
VIYDIYNEMILNLFVFILIHTIYADFSAQNNYTRVECADCSSNDAPVINEILRLQTISIQNLSGILGYDPAATQPPKITYSFSHMPAVTGPCILSVGHVIDGSKIADGAGIGVIRQGQTFVNSVDDVRMDIHETMHAFTFLALGEVPGWFNESYSILMEASFTFGDKQMRDITVVDGGSCVNDERLRLKQGKWLWDKAKLGYKKWFDLDTNLSASDITVYSQYLEKDAATGKFRLALDPTNDRHVIGAMWVAALAEIGCDTTCYINIWKNLAAKKLKNPSSLTCTIAIVASTKEVSKSDLSVWDIFSNYISDAMCLNDPAGTETKNNPAGTEANNDLAGKGIDNEEYYVGGGGCSIAGGVGIPSHTGRKRKGTITEDIKKVTSRLKKWMHCK